MLEAQQEAHKSEEAILYEELSKYKADEIRI